jgi:hypothetical protein
MHLFRDHLCERPPPPPPVEPEAAHSLVETEVTPEVLSKDSLVEQSEEPMSPISPVTSPDSEAGHLSNHVRKWSKGGFVNFLLGRQSKDTGDQSNKLKKRFSNKLKMHRTRSITRRSGELGRLMSFSPTLPSFRLPGALPGALPFYDDWEMVAPDTSVVVDMVKKEEEHVSELATAPTTPTLAVPSEALTGATPAAPLDPNERFLRVIERMDKAILSVSPDVKYPPPALLLQLRQEEKSFQQNELARVRGRPLLGRVRSFQDTLPKSAALPLSAHSTTTTDGLPSSSSSPALANAALSPPIAHKRISIDTRTGLGSLLAGNNSLVSLSP